MKQPPLCVDLDGSLILTDTLHECVAQLIKQNWLLLFCIPFWLLKSKAYLKHKLSMHCELAIDRLPLHQEFYAWLIHEKNQGRELILVTGSHQKYAQGIAQYLNLFHKVIATTADFNCTSHQKANILVETFGEKGFDYAGNHRVDEHVWRCARKAIVVNGSARVIAAAKRSTEVDLIFAPPLQNATQAFLKAIRIHQWLKNVLIFVPLVTAHLFVTPAAVQATVLAFILMSLCASATYIMNDLLDLEADRAHYKKCHRPFASGAIPIHIGALVSLLMLLTSFGVAIIFMPFAFVFILLSYLVLTLAYSLSFKRLQSLDVVSLAMLFTLRILAGAAAIGITVSFWLLAFSLFLFLSLGLVKRASELFTLIEQNKTHVEGRGYEVADLAILQNLGCASGYLSILVIALYIHSPEVSLLYARPQILWVICPILTVWVTRIWILASRGQVNEDPVEFAIQDRLTWVAASLGIAILILASLS